jgi:hypothetical protein
MARVNLPVTNISRSGVADGAEVNGDSVNNHSVANDGRMWIEVRNADASNPHTLTVRFPGVVDGQSVTPKTYPIAATTKRRIGVFPPADYGSVVQVDVDSSQLKLTAYHL